MSPTKSGSLNTTTRGVGGEGSSTLRWAPRKNSTFFYVVPYFLPFLIRIYHSILLYYDAKDNKVANRKKINKTPDYYYKIY